MSKIVRRLVAHRDRDAPARGGALPAPPGSDVAERAPAGTAPRRRRPPLPGDTPEIRQAAKTVDRAKADMVSLFDDFRLGRPVQVETLGPVVARISREVEDNAPAMMEVLRLKSKSEYTYLHSVAVSTMMLLLGRAMGYAGSELADLGLAGLLHDIGKMGVPSRILDKPGPLSDMEFVAIRTHPGVGHALLERVSGLPAVARDVCHAHHEKIDGSGYPRGLGRDEISIAARMGAICDVYDALTSDRVYRTAWTPGRALASMRDWAGHLDPDILAVFMQTLGIFPVGSLVSVRGKSLGIVLGENPRMPTRPIVRTFYSMSRKSFMPGEDVAIGSDGLLAIEDPARWNFADWTALAARIASG